MSEAKEPTVFVSYHAPDSDWARAFARKLSALGVETWIPDRSIDVRSPAVFEIEQALRKSEYLVLILGRERLSSSPSVSFEWGAAIGTGKRVLVVSPRGSNVEAAELPVYARATSFYRAKDPEKTAGEVAVEIKKTA